MSSLTHFPKNFAVVVLVVTSLTGALLAQADDPLSVTLPNGRQLHFQTLEQKAKYVAAQQRLTQTPAPQPTPATQTKAPPKFKSTMDAPEGGGIVNPTAPAFTANYYMLAASTWVGKKITLAVAYVTENEGKLAADGMARLTAYTWNSSVTSGGDQDSGGSISLVTTPAIASRLIQQCGTRIQWIGGWRVKVTMIRGEITRLSAKSDESEGGKPQYGFVVAE